MYRSCLIQLERTMHRDLPAPRGENVAARQFQGQVRLVVTGELVRRGLGEGVVLSPSGPSRRGPGEMSGHYAGVPAMLTSQLTPNLSFNMPNVSPQGALLIGMVIVAPSASLSQ